jgi:siroheme synthase-like protein
MTEQRDRPLFYPVSLDVSERPCLVVGAGPVAARKARSLVQCGAIVTVVATDVGKEMESLEPSLHAIERRPYESGDASGYRLVVTATGDSAVDGAVYDDAESSGVWINSADDLEHSSFILPAIHRDGAVTVSVSTGGLSPSLASWLRGRLATRSGKGLGALAQLLGDARERLRRQGVPVDSVDWSALLEGPLPDLVAAGELDSAQALVEEAVGQ